MQSKEESNSHFFKSEDFFALAIGILLLAFSAYSVLQVQDRLKLETFASKLHQTLNEDTNGFATLEKIEASIIKDEIVMAEDEEVKPIVEAFKKPHKWKSSPIQSLVLPKAIAEKYKESGTVRWAYLSSNDQYAFDAALELEDSARHYDFKDALLNSKAQKAIGEWKAVNKEFRKQKKISQTEPYNLLNKYLLAGLGLSLLFAIAGYFRGMSFIVTWLCTFGIYIVAIFCQVLGRQQYLLEWGIGYAPIALIMGMIAANITNLPSWLTTSIQSELYLKTGLIILGAEVLISKLLVIGPSAMGVAWVVTPIVLTTTYWFGQKVLKIESKTLNITISADMSVCGLSAAVATAAACKAKKEELTIAIGLSLVFTSIMMVAMPIFIRWIGLPHNVGGAWLGGTIDATGAVVAAGSFLGQEAMNTAITVKLAQNILIGFVALAVATIWSKRTDSTSRTPSASSIWLHFPKFILGFLLASAIFSYFHFSTEADLRYMLIDKGILLISKGIRNWLFCISFIGIGLSLNVKKMREGLTGGKPLMLYAAGQSLNIALTFLAASLFF